MATLGSKSCQCSDSDADQEVQLFRQRRRTRGEEGFCTRSRRQAYGWRPVCLALMLAGVCVPAMPLSQQGNTPPPVNGGAPGAPSSDSMHPGANQDPFAHHAEERMAERRNSERQKALVADTDRLLALAQELKADVDKSNKDTLSVDVVKRAEQIEKLARSVKEKMRGS